VVENPGERTNLLGISMGNIKADGRITGIRRIQRSWSTLKVFLIGDGMVSIGGLTLIAFDVLLPSLLGYPPFEGHPFLPYYRGLFSALWGFAGGMLLGGFLLILLFFARQRTASKLEKQIRASYLDAQPK
jgi:hypothetical protein